MNFPHLRGDVEANAASSHSLGRLPKGTNVRARAPLRLGLAGGGTDLSPYCDEHGGAILNATIDRFAYAHVFPSAEADRVVFRARDLGEEETVDPDPDLPVRQGLMLHRAVYARVMKSFCGGVGLPITVSTTIDVPAGSGLGASSALVVALVEAFRSALQLPLGPYDVARLAFEIERIDLGLAGGRQDHYAAAFGGLNYIEFLAEERAIVNPLRIRRDYLNEFESSLVIAFTGQSRRSETIIREQVSSLAALNPETLAGMHALKRDAAEMKLALLNGKIRHVCRNPQPLLGRQETHRRRRLERPGRGDVRGRDAGRRLGRQGLGRRGRRLSHADDRPGEPLPPDHAHQRGGRPRQRREADLRGGRGMDAPGLSLLPEIAISSGPRRRNQFGQSVRDGGLGTRLGEKVTRPSPCSICAERPFSKP